MDPEILSCIRWLMVCLILAMAARTYLKFLSLKFPDGGFILSLGIAMAISPSPLNFLCAMSLPVMTARGFSLVFSAKGMRVIEAHPAAVVAMTLSNSGLS